MESPDQNGYAFRYVALSRPMLRMARTRFVSTKFVCPLVLDVRRLKAIHGPESHLRAFDAIR
jgi:hypothetical protein